MAAARSRAGEPGGWPACDAMATAVIRASQETFPLFLSCPDISVSDALYAKESN